MLGAQQAVEDLLHHNGVEFDELGQGLDHLFLRQKWGEEQEDELEGLHYSPSHPSEASKHINTTHVPCFPKAAA